jgi:serine/threonine protein kinase
MPDPRETVPATQAVHVEDHSTRTGDSRSTSDSTGESKRDGEPLPRSFGRYELRQLLGAGGMGSVYLAHDSRLDRLVALKLPRSTGDSTAWRDRFLIEAKAAANIQHPNICAVHDLGEVDGQPFLTMTLLEGETLAARMKRDGPLPEGTARSIVATVARAIAAAHSRGIVHRDLKPANIMLEPDGRVVVMDFGLAIRANGDDHRITQAGTILGTPAYMSPEQLAGDPATISPATDIYSLGAILFELLTGRVPFQASTFGALAAQIERDPPPRPSSINPGIDASTDELVLVALAKRPSNRFSSAAAFADAVERLAPPPEGANEQIHSGTHVRSSMGRSSRLPSRLRNRLKWSFAVSCVLIASSAVVMMQMQSASIDVPDHGTYARNANPLPPRVDDAPSDGRKEANPLPPAPQEMRHEIDKLAKAIADAKDNPERLTETAEASLRLLMEVPAPLRRDAEERLLRPLAVELFAIRADGSARIVLEKFVTVVPELEGYRLALLAEDAKARIDVVRASEDFNQSGSPRSRAVLGIAEVREAKGLEGSQRESLLMKGVANLEAAVADLDKSDPDRFAESARREAVAAMLELSEVHVNKRNHKAALAVLERADRIGRDRTDPATRGRVRLALAISLWETAGNRTDVALTRAADDLRSILDDKTALGHEARYRLVLLELYRGGAIRADHASSNYESDKLRCVSVPLQKMSVESAAAWKLLQDIPSGNSPLLIELVEWRACLACLVANQFASSADAKRRETLDIAIQSLEKLAAADPLCATARRLRFLSSRTTLTAHPDLDSPAFKALWTPATKLRDQLLAMQPAMRLPGTPGRDARVFDCAMSMARAHAAAIPELKRSPSIREVDACLDLIRTLPRLSEDAVGELEEFAMEKSVSAAKAYERREQAQSAVLATISLSAFELIGSVDPELKVAKFDNRGLVGAAYRDFVAMLVENNIAVKPEGLPDSPATVDLLIQVDGVLAQAERLLHRIKDPDETARHRAANVAKHRRELQLIWFDKGLDAAIEAAKARGDEARAKSWSAFKAKRSGKP